MKDFNTNWTRNEFKAYILLYCANADFIETPEEIEMIKSKIDGDTYKSIHKDFDNDNDYQSLQKILSTLKRFEYSEAEIDVLFGKIKDLFLADGEYGTVEQNLYLGLKHLLSK
ncbi:MAG: hypothetical protein HRT73_16555 [Flavobacteriales bacterium]|nr:hypothetical protein [Flavobacteriales bacterium]NQX99466.1 hypothetical protein [Flavobacteriales bacterium]